MPIDPSIPLQARAPQIADPMEAFARIMQMKGAQQDQQLRWMQMDAAKREAEADARLRQAKTPDEILAAVGPERGAKILTGLQALQTATQGAYSSTQEVIRDVLAGMDAAPEGVRAEQYPMIRQSLVKAGVIKEADAPAAYDPAWFARVRSFGQAPPKPAEPFTLSPGQQRFGPNGQQIATVPEKIAPPPAGFTLSPGQTRYGPDGKPVASRPKEAAAGADDVTELTPAGLDAAALNYAKTGVMPALGMGDKTTRKQIINRAAAMMPGLDIASAKADFSANQESLKAMQKQRDAITSFEQTASKNIDVFLASAGKVVDTGSPMANSLARLVSGKMLGSADQAAYDAARQVAVSEIAKITQNPTLAGQLSDTARKEIADFNEKGATLKQTVRVMRLLKQDMANRTVALDETLNGIKDRIKKGQQPDAPKTSTAPKEGTEGSVNGTPAVWKTVNGKTGWYAK